VQHSASTIPPITYFWTSMAISVITFLGLSILLLNSYSNATQPPYVATLILYVVSLSFPFLVSKTQSRNPESLNDIRNSSRGASIGMMVCFPLGLALVLISNPNNLLQKFAPILIGYPMIFFGSSLLPYLASVKAIGLAILDPRHQKAILDRILAPPESFMILVLGSFGRAGLSKRVQLRAVYWLMPMLFLPLAVGWLMIARVVGLVSWVFIVVFYALLMMWTRNEVRHLNNEQIMGFQNVIARSDPLVGPPLKAQVVEVILFAGLTVYLLAIILENPFF
jgi:hypothetical protein